MKNAITLRGKELKFNHNQKINSIIELTVGNIGTSTFFD